MYSSSVWLKDTVVELALMVHGKGVIAGVGIEGDVRRCARPRRSL